MDTGDGNPIPPNKPSQSEPITLRECVPMSPPSCVTCRFWETRPNFPDSGVCGHHTDGSASHCRRRAPTLGTTEYRVGENRSFPVTRKSDWCGEYEYKRRE